MLRVARYAVSGLLSRSALGREILLTLPGVVDHGLFLMECETLLVEWGDGRIETRKRRDGA